MKKKTKNKEKNKNLRMESKETFIISIWMRMPYFDIKPSSIFYTDANHKIGKEEVYILIVEN